MYYYSYGIKERFATDSLTDKSNVSFAPRYFTFGLNVHITVPKKQLKLLGRVTEDVTRVLDKEIRQGTACDM
jgi:hypothetical protein